MAGEAAAYFEHAALAWQRAAASAGRVIERHYVVAGLAVRMEFAGAALLPAYCPALAHLEVPAPARATADFTIRLWECASTTVAMPPSPTIHDALTLRGDLRGFGDARYRAAYDPSCRVVSLGDAHAGTAIVCVRDVQGLAAYDRAAPLRAIFGWMARDHGRQLVHAAALGTPEGGVLVVGRGGSGKSNTAVGGMLAGLDFLGDDFCAVALDPAPTAYSLYCSAKLRLGDWASVPVAPLNPDDAPDEKRVYVLHPRYRDRLKAQIPLRAIALPRRTGQGDPALVPISPRLPLIEMASQSIAMLPGAGAEAVALLARLVRQVPCYRLDLGSRPERIARALAELIRSPARATAAS